jgi:hypothetical protein
LYALKGFLLRSGYLCCCLLLLVLCSFQTPGTLKFHTLTHHFGFIRQGQILEYDYVFRNTGSAPIQILSAEAECSCTQTVFPDKTIAPGEEGKIHLRFDSAKAIGRQERTIKISFTGSPLQVTLVFKCIVLKKKE